MQDFYQRCHVIKRTIETDDKVLEYIDKIPELVKQGFKTLANTEEYKALQLAVDKGLLDDFQIDTDKLDKLIPGHLNGSSHIYIAKGESLEDTIKYHLRKQAEDLVSVSMLSIENKMTELIRNGSSVEWSRSLNSVLSFYYKLPHAPNTSSNHSFHSMC